MLPSSLLIIIYVLFMVVYYLSFIMMMLISYNKIDYNIIITITQFNELYFAVVSIPVNYVVVRLCSYTVIQLRSYSVTQLRSYTVIQGLYSCSLHMYSYVDVLSLVSVEICVDSAFLASPFPWILGIFVPCTVVEV